MWFASKEKTKEHADELIAQARLCRDEENILEALNLLEKAIHLDKEYATPYGEYGIALAMQKNNNDRAEYNGLFAIVKDSKNAIQWRNLAHIYYLLGRYPKAYVATIMAETLGKNVENLENIKARIKESMTEHQLNELPKIEEKVKEVYYRHKNHPTIMPEPFIDESLNI